MTESNPTKELWYSNKVPKILTRDDVRSITWLESKEISEMALYLRNQIRKTMPALPNAYVEIHNLVYHPESVTPWFRIDIIFNHHHLTGYTMQSLKEDGFELDNIRVSDKTHIEFIKYYNPNEVSND